MFYWLWPALSQHGEWLITPIIWPRNFIPWFDRIFFNTDRMSACFCTTFDSLCAKQLYFIFCVKMQSVNPQQSCVFCPVLGSNWCILWTKSPIFILFFDVGFPYQVLKNDMRCLLWSYCFLRTIGELVVCVVRGSTFPIQLK